MAQPGPMTIAKSLFPTLPYDPERDFARINEDSTSARWNALMAELQDRIPEAGSDEWWALMEPVFDMDWPQHR